MVLEKMGGKAMIQIKFIKDTELKKVGDIANCSKCDKFITIYTQTKKGRKYCSDCWESILQWLKESQGINPEGCIFCGMEPVFWKEDIHVNYKRVQLCEDCYKVCVLNLKELEVKHEATY
jgi:hypothetical protein